MGKRLDKIIKSLKDLKTNGFDWLTTGNFD